MNRAQSTLRNDTVAQLPSDTSGEYRGTLGAKTKIGVSPPSHGSQLTGRYPYFRHLADVSLSGSYTGTRDIALVEKQPDGTPQGTLTLRFADHDPPYTSGQPLQGEVRQGTWTSSDGTKSFPVSLQMLSNCPSPDASWCSVAGATDEKLVERNAKAFYEAVLCGNRSEAVKYVAFPCTYLLEGKRLSLKDASAFLEQYGRIFSPALGTQIAEDVPHHMFANARGIMIADQAVWLDANGKARNFNNQKRLK